MFVLYIVKHFLLINEKKIFMNTRYDHQTAERHIQQIWAEDAVYLAANNPGPQYTIDTPPPTASGTLHIGHVFSYTQTDIIARYKRMQGFSVVYPFGVDGNGLATERYVEKKLNIRGHDMPRADFIALCLQETKLMGDMFQELWTRMGLSIDWNLCYSTISPRVHKLAQQSFIDLYNKGYIYRKAEPGLYCPTCRTSVAQAELDDAERDALFHEIVFTGQHQEQLIVATTRPEMLPACGALLYHPADTRYAHLGGTQATVPLFGFTVPIIPDDTVTPDKGTGLVMCCTFGDKTDVLWFKKHALPHKQIIGYNGRMTDAAGFLAGLSVVEARVRVAEELEKQALLLQKRPLKHTVNVHERCKKEIEFIVLTQWFVNILDHKKTWLELADTITWHPHYMKSRYLDWVEHLSWDWCISRQRFYGIPFPVWHCTKCCYCILPPITSLPIDPQVTPCCDVCPLCGNPDIKPDTDVMDTWNTSSITPFIGYDVCIAKEQGDPFARGATQDFIPMNMRPQAHDIIRTWAFYTIVKTWMHQGTVPWKDIVISGHVLHEAGGKISKSKGGADTTPEKLLTQYPADALRFWTASGALGQDIAFSDNQIRIGQKLIVKLWNAFRFVHEHSAVDLPTEPPTAPGALNEWLLHEASACFTGYQQQLERYEFSLALDAIERFFWHNFCDNYLELVKDQFFNPAGYTPEQIRATRWTLYTVGMRILQLYAPFMPYVTDALYQEIYRKNYKKASIHQTRFGQVQLMFVFATSKATAETILAITASVRTLKSKHNLSLKTPLQSLTIVVPNSELSYVLREYEQTIKGVTQASKIVYSVQDNGIAKLEQLDNGWEAVVIV